EALDGFDQRSSMRRIVLGGEQKLRSRYQLLFELLGQIIGRIILSDPIQMAVELGEDLKIDGFRGLSLTFEQSPAPSPDLLQLLALAGATSSKIAGQDPVALLDQIGSVIVTCAAR